MDIHKALLGGNNGSFCKLRSLYYPAVTGVRPGVTRCGEHSDYGTLTFLFQDSLGGLQVRGVNGEWLDAEPVEGSILVNVGDLMEVYTNGLFPSTRHRVVVPAEEVVRRRARQGAEQSCVLSHDDAKNPGTKNSEKWQWVLSLLTKVLTILSDNRSPSLSTQTTLRSRAPSSGESRRGRSTPPGSRPSSTRSTDSPARTSTD